MPIETTPTVPQAPVPIKGTGSVERALAKPEPSFIPPVSPSVGENSTRPADQGPKDIEREIGKAINTVEIMMELRERSVKFERDETTGSDIIKIVDDRTGEVIRQMPPQELLNFMRNLTKMLGNFLDERV